VRLATAKAVTDAGKLEVLIFQRVARLREDGDSGEKAERPAVTEKISAYLI
jgi:hypothetical protein